MISIIFPTYNEEDNLLPLHKILGEEVAEVPGHEFEFIFVDDHSSDKTERTLAELHRVDPRVKVIRFSRNCGSHPAIACGLRECRGNAAIVIAPDLQDPPSLVPLLLSEWQKGAKIVWG